MDNKERYKKLRECDELLCDILSNIEKANMLYDEATDGESDPNSQGMDEVWKNIRALHVKVYKFAETIRPVKKVRVWETVTFYKDVSVPVGEDTESWLADHE